MLALNSTLRENYEAWSLTLSRSWVPWPSGITMDYHAATAVGFLNLVTDTLINRNTQCITHNSYTQYSFSIFNFLLPSQNSCVLRIFRNQSACLRSFAYLVDMWTSILISLFKILCFHQWIQVKIEEHSEHHQAVDTADSKWLIVPVPVSATMEKWRHW